MTEHSLADMQNEIDRSFGHCMLRLQEYELLMKKLVTQTELKGAMSELENMRLVREESFATSSLGSLVKEFLKSQVIITDAIETPLFSKEEIKDIGEPLLGFRHIMKMSEEQHASTRKQLDELTSLRNTLAHHFLQKFDIKTIDGCSKAHVYLNECLSRINKHFFQMQSWINSFTKAQVVMSSFMQTEIYSNVLVNGIEPDGEVHWPIAGIVAALREAANKLEVNGWTNLREAVTWISENEPDQIPAKYKCRTWQQVLHDSRIFKIEYRQNKDEAKQAWYSERSNDDNKTL